VSRKSVVTAKRSVDELFLHYLRDLLSASGSFAPRPPSGLSPWTPLEDSFKTPNLPTPRKNLAGAHARSIKAMTYQNVEVPYSQQNEGKTHCAIQESMYSKFLLLAMFVFHSSLRTEIYQNRPSL